MERGRGEAREGLTLIFCIFLCMFNLELFGDYTLREFLLLHHLAPICPHHLVGYTFLQGDETATT